MVRGVNLGNKVLLGHPVCRRIGSEGVITVGENWSFYPIHRY